jgi:cobalt/nickel transport system permease protein
MALVGTFTGFAVAYALRPVAARSRAGLVTTAFVAALVNTVVAALAFVAEYAIGGAGGAGLATLFALMVGMHVLVGIGEGVITAATVAAVAAVRPDLVYLLRRGRAAAPRAEVAR